ncbi:uncharacterized protein LOC134278074 [Saccostrea cucullata]|uniref:uncharacterized protein LOC134278074 n=1 Tax=Saccostrea cuccullata TaxID=36930 RepID=UPI002ED36979
MNWYQHRKAAFLLIIGFLCVVFMKNSSFFWDRDLERDLKFIRNLIVGRNASSIGSTLQQTKPTPKSETSALFTKIWKHLLKPHTYSPFPEPVDKHYSQASQDIAVYNIFPKKKGFFIEMGAYDGKVHSNTLWLERKHNWTGLLIEGNPVSCPNIDRVKRNSWRLCACVAHENETRFIEGDELGGSEKDMADIHIIQLKGYKRTKVPCFQLINILQLIGVFHINYFTLDVEDGEMAVLISMRGQLISRQIIVDAWTIEYQAWAVPRFDWAKGKENLANYRAFFKDIGGYVEHSQLAYETRRLEVTHYLDVVFVYIETWCKGQGSLPDGKTKCSSLSH